VKLSLRKKQHITSYKLTTQLMLVIRGTRLRGAVVLRVTVDLGEISGFKVSWGLLGVYFGLHDGNGCLGSFGARSGA
jgi:hypothetical protein